MVGVPKAMIIVSLCLYSVRIWTSDQVFDRGRVELTRLSHGSSSSWRHVASDNISQYILFSVTDIDETADREDFATVIVLFRMGNVQICQ